MIIIKVLSLDGATNKTGYSIYNNKELIKYGIIDLSDIDDLTEKINTLKHLLIRIIEEFEIDRIIIEDIQLQHANVKGFKTLARLQGVLLDSVFEIDIPTELIVSTTWKSRIGINTRLKREVQKQLTIEFVKNKFGIDVVDDIADSISMGFVYVSGKI